MLKNYFERLYTYHAQANRKCINAIEATGCKDAEVIKLMSHIVLSGCTWYERVSNAPNNTKNVWEIVLLEALQEKSEQNSADWAELIRRHGEDLYTKHINYINLQGKAFRNSASDIMTHVVNHAAYHRGQIAKLMKADGYEPAVTDFIVFARENS